MKIASCVFFILILTYVAQSQVHKETFLLKDTAGLTALNVAVNTDTYQNRKSVKVSDTATANTTEVMYAKLRNSSFHNGIIEIELAGKPSSTAIQTARGFVGIAFRITEDDTRFECIYLRPTNGRAEDQVRRNHSSQYVSYPDFPWEKLRKETPGKYEAYVDLVAGKWTKVKLVVQDSIAKLYVHGSGQPTLIVSDLKHGARQKGSVGLWVGPGTEAYFRNLKITTID